MRISRRSALPALIAAPAALCRIARGASNRILIVTSSREGPHAAVIEGMQGAFATRGIPSTTLRLPADDQTFRQELNNGLNQLAIAVGIDAVRALAAVRSRTPLLATMTFKADLGNLVADGSEVKLAAAVWLDITVAQVVAGLRVVFPETTRIALIHNSSRADPEPQPRQLPAGVTLKPVVCANASELIPAMRKLRSQVEFVICLPDSSLFNKTTVEPLILASLENRLPLVGYSASFVRAGAAVGVYPDFAEIGRQAAAVAERGLNNAAPMHEEYSRQTTIAANERVLQLLGRSYKAKPGEQVAVIR